MTDEQLQRVELSRPKSKDNKSVGEPFVVTYHSHLKDISKISKKHIKHLIC